jgi:hypothetical protein
MSKKFLITEQEKKHILGLYGLINEVETTGSAADLKLDQKIEFGPGYYNPKFSYTSANGTTYNWDVDATLKPGLDKIKEFLKNNPTGYVVDVTLESGESKIPNNDVMEGRKQVEPGYLNTARLTTLKEYLNPIFKSWNDEGIKTDFKINEKTTIGPTEWVGTPFCPAGSDAKTQRGTCYNNYLAQLSANNSEVIALRDKYNSEQYFRVIINVNKTEETPEPEPVTTPEPNCAAGLKIRVHVPSHNCQNAEFFIFANNTLLYNTVGGMTANLNNSTDSRGIPKANTLPTYTEYALNPGYGYLKNGDGTYGYGFGQYIDGDVGNGRSDTFIITEEQSQEIIANGKGFIDIWMIATTTSAHQDIPNVTITKEGVAEPIFDEKPNIVQGRLLRMDACGNKVLEMGNDATVPDVTSYILQLKSIKDSSENVDPNKKVSSKKMDQKAIILDRVYELNQRMYSLVSFLSSKLEDNYYNELDDSLYNEIITRLNTDYEYFDEELKNEEPMSLDKEGYRFSHYEFNNRTIQNNDLYGDVRQGMDRFFNDYSLIFYDDVEGVFSPNGPTTKLKEKPSKLYKNVKKTSGFEVANL